MTEAELLAEWNTNGCRSCMSRWGLSADQVRWRVKRLRAIGHDAKRWPRRGRPKIDRDHEAISTLCQGDLRRKEVAQQTGLTINQVRYSQRVSMKAGK